MVNEKISKMADLANLTARLREVETEHEASDDLQDLRTRMLAALGIYRMSRFNFGETLYAYREALPHGAWLPVVQAISAETGIADRTIREILSDYERVRETPAEVVQALLQAGIDPAEKRRAKVVEIAVEGHRSGIPPVHAVKAAFETTKRPAQTQTSIDLEPSKDEKLIFQVRLVIRKALDKVPQNKRLEYLRAALCEEITGLLGDEAREFVVTPTKPTLDLMGRKRSA
jgi:hypothetical protein